MTSITSQFLPENASILTRLGTAIGALRVLVKSPDDPMAAALINTSMDEDVFRSHSETLAKTEYGRALLKERPSLQKRNVDLVALGQLPEGTLGRAFAQYFIDNKIHPFESPYEVRNDVDYLITWYRETHDLHHVLTGYRTDAIGEMELQAFALGNLGFRHAKFILTTAALVRPHGLPPMWKYFQRLLAAYRRGQQTANLFSIRYDQLLEERISTVQQSLHMPAA